MMAITTNSSISVKLLFLRRKFIYRDSFPLVFSITIRQKTFFSRRKPHFFQNKMWLRPQQLRIALRIQSQKRRSEDIVGAFDVMISVRFQSEFLPGVGDDF